ncbi:trypsin alpha-3-like [Spodoptera frugiperda]|uniref:Trypsin alpha-3-like n=1 Tax=Spodoptera frugiperda TaxID=7108 RepID=A0A9R0EUY4_SPOFR|nr:trypsin alpha-3-like [Spodoptera frugiperda]
MDYKAGLLVFFSLVIGSLAFPAPEDDLSKFFDHTDGNARIIGGSEAAAGSHPHMVALIAGIYGKMFICAGSLVTQRSVLTAAYCIHMIYSGGSIVPSARAAVGSNRWDSGTEYTLLGNLTHPDFNLWTGKNDITVVITSTNVVLSSLVQPVALIYDYIGGGVTAIVAGWGSTTPNSYEPSDILLEVSTTTIGSKECIARVLKAAIKLKNLIYVNPRNKVCTLNSSKSGINYGDSGSALLRADNGQQFGIVAWGFPGVVDYPDRFVRIGAYESWLKSVIV